MQHGSIRLQPDAELFAQVFGAKSFTTIQLPQSLSVEKIIAALVAAASNCFDMQIEVKPLSSSEWEAILAKPISEAGSQII